MNSVDRKAADLRDLVQDILKQFQCVNSVMSNGPHAELSIHSLKVVEVLGMEGPRMMRELAEFLGVAVNSMTTIVDNLEKAGLVMRHRSEEDRRIVRVALTDSGQAVYQSVANINMELFRNMLSVLSEDEQEIFMVLFRKIARAGRNQVQKMTPQSETAKT